VLNQNGEQKDKGTWFRPVHLNSYRSVEAYSVGNTFAVPHIIVYQG